MTDEERETARLTWLQGQNAVSPLGDLGCYIAYTAAWCVVSFAGGFVVGAPIAVLAGRWQQWWRFGLWGGALLAGVAAIVTIHGHVVMAVESWRDGWKYAMDTYDFGEVTIIRCETDGAAYCEHGRLLGGPVCALSVGDEELLVLHGFHLEDLRDEDDFPHERFEIEVNLHGLVLEYRAEGRKLAPLMIDYEACDESERRALDDVADQTVVRGTVNTFLDELTREKLGASDEP